ncbi:penicillin-binding protein [Corynebacterium sp. 153RC1]|uniref:transglycosylase domain-containing protein n=1 Tax=unclassified Corynebacterium TaxID=2624378 RepID=UPI00211C2C09|nr:MULTISPECIES: transglycosylase domain-containing protein [unclassified Corynebacterium]MCQ9371419.1 penicillin-binding protein [Corynebacterium sp. 35RC1]MCQ9353343.1 penicillin-binding protein [Corynebacterium sp. 209RC1]MCQ9355598.1 penicillin-binding protein [Corynebacterium sp. 1222RC1]MCQ9357782.1 penicillin-binding protein [Corynebacterium sp. 122RC1]MCQ9359987.1 penicillin-binding protein [Corynebacterium sp. 142RC1]
MKKAGGEKSWVKPTIWGTLAAVIAAPLVAFMVAYIVVDVPRPGELVSKQVSQIFASDGTTELARVVPAEGNRVEVPLETVPEVTRNAVLAAEDREFYENNGFSFTGFARAALGQITGNTSAGGGSTITQQYVKNMLVGNDYSYMRKAKELVYSVKMANEWDKDTVLESYLNTIYFGRNAYGIDAAARAYFGIGASELNAAQSAVLAASIQRPSQLDPWTNRAEAEDRWNYVLDGMVSIGALTEEERAAQVYPDVQDPTLYSAYTEATGPNGLIKNQVIAELGSLGITEEDLQTLGLRITTTIDTKVQNATVNAVDAQMPQQQENVRVAAVTVDPNTGAVRGYYGGADAAGYDYANAGIPTGSTFKIFAVAAALQQGIPTSAYYSSEPFQLSNGEYVESDNGASCGTCSMKEALMKSYNPTFLRVQEDLENGTQDTADMAHALGIARSIPGEEQTLTEGGAQPYEGIVLGQYNSRPIDMAHAVATLANDGVWHETYFVERVQTASGETLYEHQPSEGERRVSVNVAANTIDAMMPIAAWSGGNTLAGGRVSASKTGTVQLGETGLNRDAWMVGATPQLATAVWAGTSDNTALLNSWGGSMYGAGLPATLWKSILDASLEGQEFQTFTPAEPLGYQSSNYQYTPSWSPWSGSGRSNSGDTSGDTATDQNAPAEVVPEVPAAPAVEAPLVPVAPEPEYIEILPGVTVPIG